MADDADIEPPSILMEGRCPNCRKDKWSAAPAGTVAGLRVRPFICETCGYIALLHDPGAD